MSALSHTCSSRLGLNLGGGEWGSGEWGGGEWEQTRVLTESDIIANPDLEKASADRATLPSVAGTCAPPLGNPARMASSHCHIGRSRPGGENGWCTPWVVGPAPLLPTRLLRTCEWGVVWVHARYSRASL